VSFVDNFWDTAKSWAEVIVTKGAYFKTMELGGQAAAGAETTTVTTVVKPAAGKLGTFGLVLATGLDLASRVGCRIGNDPSSMSAYTNNPF
jgi:hypothetical protein